MNEVDPRADESGRLPGASFGLYSPKEMDTWHVVNRRRTRSSLLISGACQSPRLTKGLPNRGRHRRRAARVPVVNSLLTSLHLITNETKDNRAMNHYGLMALEHWTGHLPHRYASLTDPTTFFSDLGEQLLEAVTVTAAQLTTARQLPVDQPYLERLATLQLIHRQAEEIVLTDMLWSLTDLPVTATTAAATTTELPEALLWELPAQEDVEMMLWDLEQEARNEMEAQGLDPTSAPIVLTEDQAARQSMLRALLAVATLPRPVDELTDAELRDRLARLREIRPLVDPQ